MKTNIKKIKRTRRHAKIRTRLSGTAQTPRLAVFRSNKVMYAQLIDDAAQRTLAQANSFDIKGKKGEVAHKVGKAIAEKAQALKIKAVVFDRGGFGFKGRVKALADGAREGGLTF